MREIEHAEDIATRKDYTVPIIALDKGIQILKAQAHDVKRASAALTRMSAPSSKNEANAGRLTREVAQHVE